MINVQRSLLVVFILTLVGLVGVQSRESGVDLSYRLNRSIGELRKLSKENRDLRIAVTAARDPEHLMAKASQLGMEKAALCASNVVKVSDLLTGNICSNAKEVPVARASKAELKKASPKKNK